MVSYYLDTSAVVKIVKNERETHALSAFLYPRGSTAGPHVSSDLLRTELCAVSGRHGVEPEVTTRVLSSLILLNLTASLCESAGRIAAEWGVRSLDAIHLASALSQLDKLDGLVTYDQSMSLAAQKLGLRAFSPS